jgi:hypothetical protein
MKLFYLPNLKSATVTETTVDQIAAVENIRTTTPSLQNMTKDQYREWCSRSTTVSYFISPWEGLAPNARVTAKKGKKDSNNPAKRLHGIIAEYDSPHAEKLLSEVSNACDVLPNWASASFTPGHIRLTWEFAEPVHCYTEEICEKFIEILDRKLGISKALPGFDEASFRQTQYFEMGSLWHRNEDQPPVPSDLLELCLMEAAEKAKVKDKETPEIPMERVAEEIERQFPGRCPNAFVEGSRQPLFWIDDGIERIGAIVGAHGMHCFSTRAGADFLGWRAILGNKFVSEFEQEKAGNAAKLFFFDGKVYWTKHNAEQFVYLNKDDVKMHLKAAGCNDRPANGQNISEVERVLVHVQTQRRVAAAVPVLFQEEDTVEIYGERYLNISNKKPVLPGDNGNIENFPWLHDYWMKAFDGEANGIPAREYFLAWFRRFYESALAGRPLPGHVVFIAGEAHTGKSFLNRCLIGDAVGGSVGAEKILMGETNFNKGGAENALWRCDDAATEGNWKTRELFTKNLKKMAADPVMRYEPKFRDSIELPFMGRVVVTCNIDAESLKILPSLDGTIKDKLMLFKLCEGFKPHFFGTNHQNEERLRKELPYFLRFMLDYEFPEAILDPVYRRFGVRAFHHSDLVHQSTSESQENIFAELMEPWINAKRSEGLREVEMSATQLLSEVIATSSSPGLLNSFSVRGVGRMLNKILVAGMVPDLKSKRLLDGKNLYRFTFKKAPKPETHIPDLLDETEPF